MAGRNSPAGAHFRKGTDLKQVFIKGGAAGNLTVTGVEVGDPLYWVTGVSRYSGVLFLGTCVDFTSEFSITAANVINNATGTSTAGFILAVGWGDLNG
jgi:hypothetical protein